MANTIKCKNCGQEIEIDKALEGQIEARVLTAEHKKHVAELEQVKKEAGESALKIIEEEKLKAEAAASSKNALKLKQLQDETEEEKKDNKELREQLSSLMQELRESKKANANAELEMQKTLGHILRSTGRLKAVPRP